MKKELREHLSVLVESLERFPWQDRAACGAFLAQTYYYSRHTTRILALAASRFGFEDEKTHKRFIKHASEEMSHEILAERDLKALSMTPETFGELASTRAFYQVHYHTIEHEGPWSIFGYIVALEGLAAEKAGWVFEQIKKYHGEKAGSFSKVHAEEDVGHVEEALKTLEGIPAREREAVLRHLATTCCLYDTMLADCAARASGAGARRSVA